MTQAAVGQWELFTSTRPLTEVIDDPQTDSRTRGLLEEVISVKNFGSRHGLSMHENYEEFVELERPYIVWFVNASHPLAFLPRTFWFPIVGSFPGLAWFDEGDAREFATELEDEGWDVNVRGVTAYSTGGWFDDPILSSMLADNPAAVGLLANVVLHESLHATVIVENQQYFNESLASFVANELTPAYLTEHHGAESPELQNYQELRRRGEIVAKILDKAVKELWTVYASQLPDDAKYAHKKRIFDALQQQLQFETPPNNATLIGFSLYNEGAKEMERLRAACPSWPAFLAAVDSLGGEHFPQEQSPIIGPVFDRLTANDCKPLPKAPPEPWNKQLREQQRRERRLQANRTGR